MWKLSNVHLMVEYKKVYRKLTFDIGVKSIKCFLAQCEDKKSWFSGIVKNPIQVITSETTEDKKKRLVLHETRLVKTSENYTSDDSRTVENKCWMLMAGQGNDCGLVVKADYNLFDDPTKQKQFNMNVHLEEFTLEACPSLVEPLLKIAFEFRYVYTEGDLVFLKHKHVRKLQHYAALEYLKADMFPGMYGLQTFKKTAIKQQITPEMVTKYFAQYYLTHGIKWFATPQQNALEAKLAQEKKEKLKKRLDAVDEMLQEVNAHALVHLGLVRINWAPDGEARGI
jgi:hypothetical protein